MTNKEAIHCMKSYLPNDKVEHCISCPYYGSNKANGVYYCKSNDAHKLAIQALEQTEVLDKIRVEIQEELKQDNHSFYRAALEDVLKIIDKYKAGE